VILEDLDDFALANTTFSFAAFALTCHSWSMPSFVQLACRSRKKISFAGFRLSAHKGRPYLFAPIAGSG
jgi:hypothetical protein